MTGRESEREPEAQHTAEAGVEAAAETAVEAEGEAAFEPAGDTAVPAAAEAAAAAAVSAAPQGSGRAPLSVRRSRALLHSMLALLVLGAVVAAILGAFSGEDSGLGAPRTVSTSGGVLRTNLASAPGSDAETVYLTLPVNTEPDAVVLETGDSAADDTLHEFVSAIDTLVPGEHVIAVQGVTIHVLVDGISGQ